MNAEIDQNNINILEVSKTDLSINDLSPYVQTIHQGSNSYIIRAGSSNLDAPLNILYSINLTTGELVNEVLIEQTDMVLKIAGA